MHRLVLLILAVLNFSLAEVVSAQEKSGNQKSGNQKSAQTDRQLSTEHVDFETQIRPLFVKHCADCHGAKTQEGSLRLDAKHGAFKGGDGGRVIVPFKSSSSELIRRLIAIDDDTRMPPEKSLSKTDVDLVKRWIDQGAQWPETKYDRSAAIDPRLKHWAFQPVKSTEPPIVGRFENPVDRFVAESLKRNGLTLSGKADRRTLIRRLTLDLTGLPPTPTEIDNFEKDTANDAYSKVVRRLLDSPRYGERWAQHWLDIVRYADTHGFEVNTPRENAWPYRDYVIQSFNDDKPYDQFIKEQLAGDTLEADSATGFLVASAVLLPGQIGQDDASKRLARQDELDEMVVGTGATFLGLTVGCARCHDHKFDPITTRDYYALQAFFAGVDFGEREIKDKASEKRLAQARSLTPRINELKSEIEKWTPRTFSGHSLLIDESDPERTTFLMKENGLGINPEGTARGYRSDPGSMERNANASGGQYTWWDNVPGKDVMFYRPRLTGKFRLWISWGVHGRGVHTRDARYILDSDGDPYTRNDQQQLAQVDQYYPTGVTAGTTDKKPTWSGFLNAGIVTLKKESIVILRGGETGTGITADVIAFQSAFENEFKRTKNILPRLRTPVNFTRNVERFQSVTAKFVRFTTLATDSNSFREPCLDELEIYTSGKNPQNVALQSNGGKATSSGNYGNGTGIHQLPHINDGQHGNSNSWISNQKGKGWVQIELPRLTEINRVVWGRDRSGKFKDRLPVRYRIDVSSDGLTWRTVASHSDRNPFGSPASPIEYATRLSTSRDAARLAKLTAEINHLNSRKNSLERKRMVYAGTFRTPDRSFVLRRGNPEMPGESVAPQVPELFDIKLKIDSQTREHSRRIALANWIADSKNPLTARVMVNRVWTYHFGRGLVETPSDFGLNASPPSHPRLLDWLAAEFVRQRWSLKSLHFLLVTSETYQQRATVRAKPFRLDAGNRLYWRFLSRRLESESIRDSILAVSGELNPKMGGPGFNFFKTRGGLSGFPVVTDFGPEELRRMIYAHKIRMEPAPVFGAFDCPDAGQAAPLRSRSTTAVQALNLFNSDFVYQRSISFAKRVKSEKALKTEGDWVNRSFVLALGRLPSDLEFRESVKLVQSHGLASLGRVLFNSSEFLFMP